MKHLNRCLWDIIQQVTTAITGLMMRSFNRDHLHARTLGMILLLRWAVTRHPISRRIPTYCRIVLVIMDRGKDTRTR